MLALAPPPPRRRAPSSFCSCFNGDPRRIPECTCGEDLGILEWRWEGYDEPTSWAKTQCQNVQVLLHPFYSAGTAVARGDTCFDPEYTHYFEVKMMSEPYGTDIMVGVGSDKIHVNDSLFHFRSFLGRDEESYGMSYTGAICHNATVTYDSPGFRRGTIIGVKVDMWSGTLEFFLNRIGLGISFTSLRKHPILYPMVCSTAAQSVMRLIYASSWKTCLLSTAGKVLANSWRNAYYYSKMPPVLRGTLMKNLVVILPSLQIKSTPLSPAQQAAHTKRRHFRSTF